MVELRVIAVANGFSGDATAYFGPREVEGFAMALARYPLDDDGPLVIKASGGNDKRVSLAAFQTDDLGHVAVDVDLAAPAHTRPYTVQEVHLRVFTSYEGLARFSRELLLMLAATSTRLTSLQTPERGRLNSSGVSAPSRTRAFENVPRADRQ